MKRKKSNSKIIIICVTVLLCMLSISYAAWNDKLSLDAAANTGSIKLDFTVDSYEGLDITEIEYDDEEIYFQAQMPEQEGTLKIKVENTGLLPVKLWVNKKDYIILDLDSERDINLTITPEFAGTNIYYSAPNGNWKKSMRIEGEITIPEPVLDELLSDVTETLTPETVNQSQPKTPESAVTVKPSESQQPTVTNNPDEIPQQDKVIQPEETTRQAEPPQAEQISQPTENTKPDAITESSDEPERKSEKPDVTTDTTDKGGNHESSSGNNVSTDSGTDNTSSRDSAPSEQHSDDTTPE